ncbi:unnamed protein product [Phytophthora lilii]|uniref:Unnamed protein product n=1 Tax=Phytophthora lilii TaxID=2077276 RepID=A0A9W7CW33_9STRA|nr:unnamed protein product [Phytophthora lilii]
MAGFKAAIVEGHSTAMTRIVNNVKEIEGINLQQKPALVYRSIRKAKERLNVSAEVEYGLLPGFLTAFATINPGSRVCLQLDSNGRFYRLFLSLGGIVSVQDAMLPVWEVDGTHMKPPAYNGVCLTLLGKDGDKRNIPVAVAYVHKETIDNFAWFFTNCKIAGIKLDDRVTFTDRGKQLGAQELMAQWGLKLHLKFCSLHFLSELKHLNIICAINAVG